MRPITLRAPAVFERAFRQIRSELDVPLRFPDAVENEAAAATPADVPRVDARNLPLVAIDPPGATDLDQAFAAERNGDGYRVFYAIADVGAFLTPGGLIDAEARKRGTTLYCPDFRAPLHPTVISEDRASLLAGSDKTALLWTIDLDAAGHPTSWHLERALVQTKEAISYHEAQKRIDAMRSTGGAENGSGRHTGEHTAAVDDCLALLAEIGPLRQEREAERGGVSLQLPAQEIASNNGGYSLEFDQSLPVEGWNAQISLLTGMIAGQAMFDAGVGILRTLPPAQEHDVNVLRNTAAALGLSWPSDQGYADFVRDLRPTSAAHNAFLVQCTRLFKGAGYYGFNGDRPEHPQHGAIASIYAHVTAPLRRLVDRFGNEIVLALAAGEEPPAWAVEALTELPSLMGQSRQRESTLERALLDIAEVLTLEHHVGATFDAIVVNIIERHSKATVQIPDPAIVTQLPSDGLSLADHVKLRLAETDRDSRQITFDVL